MPLNRILKSPCPNNAMPMITTSAPVILLIHKIVRILKFPWKRLRSHDIRNQYVTDPELTARMIGATFHV